MRKEVRLNRQARVLALHHRLTEPGGVPVYDDGRQQIERRHTIVLSFGRAVLYFALPADAQSILQRVMRLTFVQFDLHSPLHIRVEYPIQHEQCAFDTADFPQSNARSFWRGYEASLRRIWLGATVPAVIVATILRMSGQFDAIRPSRILPPIIPLRFCGVPPASNT